MKTTLRFQLLIVLAAAGGQVAFGASVMLDTFSEGDFLIPQGGILSDQSSIASLLIDTRRVEGTGLGIWSASIVAGSGVLNYDVPEYIPGGRGTFLELRYTRGSGIWSLLGYDALVFDFASVTGTGLMEVYITASNASEVVQVPVTTPGPLNYSLENMAAPSLDDVGALTVRFYPEVDGFSVSLDQITVVPEPSVSVMLFAVLTLIIGRRARRHQ